jgi:hypothetical protein
MIFYVFQLATRGLKPILQHMNLDLFINLPSLNVNPITGKPLFLYSTKSSWLLILTFLNIFKSTKYPLFYLNIY